MPVEEGHNGEIAPVQFHEFAPHAVRIELDFPQ